MDFRRFFVETAQNEITEKKFNTGLKYKNSKWRPSVFFDAEKREIIESHFLNKGFKTFNEYVNDLISKDLENEQEKK